MIRGSVILILSLGSIMIWGSVILISEGGMIIQGSVILILSSGSIMICGSVILM